MKNKRSLVLLDLAMALGMIAVAVSFADRTVGATLAAVAIVGICLGTPMALTRIDN